MTTPSFLSEDPEFQQPEGATGEESGDNDTASISTGVSRPTMSVSSGVSSGSSHATLNSAGTNYFDLPEESRDLDSHLYNVLKMCVKGSKNVLLQCVKFPSYIQGMCILFKHCDISRNDRISRSFDDMDTLSFDGDAQRWEIDAISRVRNLYESGGQMVHYALSRVMKSFDGKLKHVQYKIAEDMNNMEIDDNTNIFDMLQGYASLIASVGDSKSAVAYAAGDESPGDKDGRCGFCNIYGHCEKDCRKKRKGGGKGGGKGKGKFDHSKKDCHKCGEIGHISRNCPMNGAPAPAPANVTQAAPSPSVEAAHAHAQEGLTALLTNLRQSHSAEIVQSRDQPCEADCQQRTSDPVRSVPAVRRARWGQRGNAHIGEASHPGPSAVTVAIAAIAVSVITMSLCGGIEGGAASLRAASTVMDRFISVENNATKQLIANNMNPAHGNFPGIDHTWHEDIMNITEQDIIDLGAGNIKLLMFGPPCKDMSKLRLLPDRQGHRPKGDPRLGLDGPTGRLFRQCIWILSVVLKHNPDCEYFSENVCFRDLIEHWLEVCNALGDPAQIVSHDYDSYTKRNRSYWHNFKALRAEGLPPKSYKDPNECREPGRTIVTYTAYGRECVRPIGASWKGPSESPYADTQKAVKVKDEKFTELQDLYPIEAERLMGLVPNSTAGNGVTARQRLIGIGDGWDVNVTTMLLSYSDFVRKHGNSPEVAQMREHSNSYPAALNTAVATQSFLVQYQQDHGPEALSALILDQGFDDVKMCLELVHDYYTDKHLLCLMSNDNDPSVLDSGSAKHLQKRAVVTDSDNRCPLSGFDGSTQWTEGNGYLPISVIDEQTGTRIPLDIEDTDLMTDKLITQILSLGKLLRAGFDFHLTDRGKECYALTPGGAHRIRVDLGHDDLLRLNHRVRSGTDAAKMHKLPVQVNALRRSVGDIVGSEAAYRFFHEVLNHSSVEKIYRTLGATKGFKQIRLPDCFCDTCAQSKARNFGLKQTKNTTAAAPVMPVHDPVFDDDNAEDYEDPEMSHDLPVVVPKFAGRRLGVQAVPRFDLYKLKPFEVMFVDNKDYPCYVRGGYVTTLLFVDYKTRAKYKVDLRNKTENGRAFSRIVSFFGIHKLDYHCRVFTDGCGSMVHVEDTAEMCGVDHAYIPPHQQSLNEAEKVADQSFASARALMVHSKAPDKLFGKALDYVLYTDFRTATTASREWKTPFEMVRGIQPSITKLHRFYTRCFVGVPKSKRKALADKGLHNLRAEPGRFIGFQSLRSSTYAAMLDGDRDRLVHSINVTFDDTDYTSTPGPDIHPIIHELDLPAGAQSEEAKYEETDCPSADSPSQAGNSTTNSPIQSSPVKNPLCNWPQAVVPIENMPNVMPPLPANVPRPEFYDPDETAWNLRGDGTPGERPRPHYHNQCIVQNLIMLSEDATKELDECFELLHESQPRWSTYYNACFMLALHATKDMKWEQVLQSDDAEKAIEALELEMASLMSTILTPLDTNDPDYERALKEATPGRILLDIKRAGVFKARGVKQGFKEDRELADGPDFNYYAHVAKLVSVRTVLFRMDRGTRRIAIKDVRTAFLQSHKYPPGTVKYICFKHPITSQWAYFRQSGPIYGEASAVIRWENTIAPWLVEQGFIRGDNEPCAFLNAVHSNLVDILFVDDNLFDGEEEDINWIDSKMDERFDCKGLEWLEPGPPLDHLGMDLSMDNEYTYICMSTYIDKCLEALKWNDVKIRDRPMASEIDPDSPLLEGLAKRKYLTGVGMAGWLEETCRLDIALCRSRCAQYLSKPNESAMEHLEYLFGYLKGTKDCGLRAPLHRPDVDLFAAASKKPSTNPDLNCGWEFYCDSDFAGNPTESNNRRSQNGFVALLNGAPVLWGSKVSSVAFAHPKIGEAHPDMSSGAAEVYAAGNASFDFLHLSYIASEMAIDFPEPLLMQMDNKAAEAFTNKTAFRSKLNHIDNRKKWVKTLQNHEILRAVHVPGVDNLADLFTKILETGPFVRMRNMMMHRVPVYSM